MMVWVPFLWAPLELEGHTLERAAILVEATLPSLELSGYLQLDLGIPRTVLYAKAFQEGELEAYILTRKAPMLGRERPVLNLPVQIGSLVLTSPLLLEEQESGEHNGRPILGSLGADALNQRVLILDFPRQRLAFLEAFPDSLKARGFFAPMETDPAGRPVLYAVHRGEKVRLLYDTGSSAFGLLTSRDRWEQLTHGQVVDTLDVPSWGNLVRIYGGHLRHPLQVGSLELPVDRVYFVDMPGLKEVLDRMKALGVTGNRPFWERTLVLDVPGGTWGVLPAEVLHDSR